MITAKGRAKVNLCLRVIGKRADGYHEILSVMQSVDLFDTVSLDPLQEGEQDSFEILLSRAVAGPMPNPPDLTERALEAFRRHIAPLGPLAVKVAKNIPIGAGLGGGSADAAAALVAANEIAGAPATLAELAALGAEIGSDVPFAVLGGTLLATGRGEQLQDIASPSILWWVLGVPDFHLVTKDVFEKVVPPHEEAPSSCELTEPLGRGAVAGVGALLRNDLEASAFRLRPDLHRMKEAMLAAGSAGAVMSGSGSTIAGLCISKDHAEEVASSARLSFQRVHVVSSAPLGAEIVAD